MDDSIPTYLVIVLASLLRVLVALPICHDVKTLDTHCIYESYLLSVDCVFVFYNNFRVAVLLTDQF